MVSATELAQRFEFLSSWSRKELEALRMRMVVRELAIGEPLISEGSHTNSVFLIYAGELVVDLQMDGRMQEVGSIGPGGIVGEVSLFDPGPATATVLAASAVTVLVLERKTLDHVFGACPEAGVKLVEALARVLAQRVRDGTERLEALRGMPESAPARPSGLLAALRSLIGLRSRRAA